MDMHLQLRHQNKPLTFLSQHGDEGTDEFIVVVGPSLVINLWKTEV